MADDFSFVYRPWTAEELHQQQLDHQLDRERHDLYQALAKEDFPSAAAMLKADGACNWDKLFPKGTVTVFDDNTNEGRQFYTHMSYDKDSTTIEQREKMTSGGGLFSDANQFVPRLTVTDNNCPPEKP